MRTIDYPFLFLTLALLVIGLLVVSSSSIVISQKNFGTFYYYTMHQAIYGGLLGIIALYVFAKIPYHFWRRAALPAMLFTLLLLTAVFVTNFGREFGGAKRWLNLGPISFQPSELLKLTFVFYLASWLEKKKRDIKNLYTAFIPFVIMMSVVAVFLAMQPDIGTLLIIIAASVALYFVGGGKISQIFGIAFIGVVSLALLVQIAPYRLNRFLVFLHPELDPKGIGYQINQAFIAIGSGGFSGLGFGKSIQKYNYLPEPTGDSVFAIVTEETGFIGAAFLIFLFLLFFWRGIYIARHAPDRFGALLATGIVSGIATQAFINMAAISGLLPLTGIPLPFISYGGTSLVITLASVGVVLNVSKHH